MSRTDYEEFDLQLDRVGDGYTVRVVQSPTGPTSAVPFQLPGTPDSLKLLVLTLRAVRRIRALENEAAPDARTYGAELFNAVFHDDVLSALRGSLHVASSRDRGLRVRLRFTDPTVLANVPWELLYDPVRHRFLCQYGKYPVVRFLEIPEPVAPLKVEGPVRMLVVISAPRDYPHLDVEAEWERLSTVLRPLVEAGRLRLDRLPTASLAEIHRALLEEEYHVFHYIGHGGVDPRTGDGVLALTGPDGLSRLESGQDLGVMLSNSPIRLAVLNSCEGARINDVDPYAGTAISLVQQGIPAVVAMQFEISDEAAFAFSSTLYDAITDGRPIDLAVTLARQAILATSRTEWATPVLYLRTSDGVIFDISAPAAPSGASTTPPVTTAPTPSATTAPATSAPLVSHAPAAASAPRGLTGQLFGRHDVDLRWEVPESGALPVSWEVLRDGVVVDECRVPGVTDVVPGPGVYMYRVVAIGEDRRRSKASEPFTVSVPAPPEPAAARARAEGRPSPSATMPVVRPVPVPVVPHVPAGTAVGRGDGRSERPEDLAVTVRGGSRWWLALLLVALAGGVAFLLWPRNGGDGQGNGVGPPLAPINVVATVDGLVVDVSWETAGIEATQPVRWRVYRDLSAIAEVQGRSYRDQLPEGGRGYFYTVVAIGADGQESPRSDPALAVAAAPGRSPSPEQKAPVVADLQIEAGPALEGGGSNERIVTVIVTNSSPGNPSKAATLTIELTEPGLFAGPPLHAESQAPLSCPEQGQRLATCELGDLEPRQEIAVQVIVGQGDAGFLVAVRVASSTADPAPGNNTDKAEVPAAARPRVDVLEPDILTVTPAQ